MAKKNEGNKNEAKEEIVKIFLRASKQTNTSAAQKLVQKARFIAMRHTIRLTKTQRLQFCRTCNTYFIDGVTVRRRIRSGVMSCTCLTCGSVQKI